MSKVCVRGFAVSVDGYAAGPDQSEDNPMGVGGGRLHEWIYPTHMFQQMIGGSGGDEGIDDQFMTAAGAGIGATIMGRNMFGPVRGSWGDGSWTGWWGDTPPFHHPVFVLTHQPRDPITLAGGTTFHFVTQGIHSALEQARATAGERDVRIGGGTETVREFVRAGLVDELQLAVVPVLLGGGERLFDDELGPALVGYECTEQVGSGTVLHVRFVRKAVTR